MEVTNSYLYPVSVDYICIRRQFELFNDFSQKISFNISGEMYRRPASVAISSHMQYQVLFSLKNSTINFRMSSTTNLIRALSVKRV